MKVCFVSDFFSPSIGGTQILCKSIAEYFLENGHEIEIVTTFDAQRNLSDFLYRIKQLPNLNFSKSDFFINNSYDHVFFLCDLFSDSLNSADLNNIKNKTLILNLDENVLNWINTQQHGFTEKNVKNLVNKIKNFTNVVSFCKNAPINKFLESNNIKYNFIPNFSRDVQKSYDLTEKLRSAIPSEKKIIFNHGNIEHRKNQLSLVKSFLSSSLKEEYCLVLLGSPRDPSNFFYMEEILNIKKKLDFNNDVILLKGTNNLNVVDTMLKMSSIFVLPSLAEGLPLVLIEAMSAGLPWISTPCGGVPGVMSNFDSGKILDNFDITPEILTKSIDIVKNKNSRKDWEENFTKEICCQKYLELL